MSDHNNDKILRQLRLYRCVLTKEHNSPSDLMEMTGVSFRTLQRDITDLRDCGMINLKYYKQSGELTDTYLPDKDKEPVFDRNATGRHLQHLIRLRRLCTLIRDLPRTQEEEMDEYDFFYEDLEDDPEYDEISEKPDSSGFTDIKAEYYKLFPESNERMRQRDFATLREIGYNIGYSKKYRTIIFEPDERI